MAVTQVAGMAVVPAVFAASRGCRWRAAGRARWAPRARRSADLVRVCAAVDVQGRGATGWPCVADLLRGARRPSGGSRPRSTGYALAAARRRCHLDAGRSRGRSSASARRWPAARHVSRRGAGRLGVRQVSARRHAARRHRRPRRRPRASGVRHRRPRRRAAASRWPACARLDYLVLTHGDPDHIGGAAAILREFRPREVWEGIPVPRVRAAARAARRRRGPRAAAGRT